MITEYEFLYCPKCSGNFQKKEDNLLICTKCDLHYYINPKACNAVVLKNTKEEILLVQRKHDPQKGLWDLPGGFVDINETIEESIQREMREELNIRVTNLTYLKSYVDTYEFGGIKAHTICTAFEATIPKGAAIKIGDDVAEFTFMNKEDIPYDKIAFESIKAILLDLN